MKKEYLNPEMIVIAVDAEIDTIDGSQGTANGDGIEENV